MLSLIQRSLDSLDEQLVLLAPRQARIPGVFNNVSADPFRHEQFLRDMQALRGAIYLSEGNLTRHQLTPDGRHETPEDNRSWHILMTDGHGQVRSCALYLEHDYRASFDDLRVRSCPLARDAEWKDKLKGAVESEIARARAARLGFAELGGWAIQRERRGTPEGLMMALATYGLSRIRGGALGITTANVAHSCSAILRRLGGAYLHFGGSRIPAYFDPRYNADIELLRFDSWPKTRYADLIDIAKAKLSNVCVISGAFSAQVSARLGSVTGSPQPELAA